MVVHSKMQRGRRGEEGGNNKGRPEVPKHNAQSENERKDKKRIGEMAESPRETGRACNKCVSI